MKYRKVIIVEVPDGLTEEQIDEVLADVDFEIGDVEQVETHGAKAVVDNYWL